MHQVYMAGRKSVYVVLARVLEKRKIMNWREGSASILRTKAVNLGLKVRQTSDK